MSIVCGKLLVSMDRFLLPPLLMIVVVDKQDTRTLVMLLYMYMYIINPFVVHPIYTDYWYTQSFLLPQSQNQLIISLITLSFWYSDIICTVHRAPGDVNSDGRALWVGNINSSAISEGMIRKLFQQWVKYVQYVMLRHVIKFWYIPDGHERESECAWTPGKHC